VAETQTREASADDDAAPLGRWSGVRAVVEALIVLGIVALFGVIIWGIMRADSSATVPADERLVQLVQWTIGVVLTVAVALVGYNWLTTRRSAEQEQQLLDKRFAFERDRLSDKMREWETRLAASEATIESMSTSLETRLSFHESRLSTTLEATDRLQDVLKDVKRTQVQTQLMSHLLELTRESVLVSQRVFFHFVLGYFVRHRAGDLDFTQFRAFASLAFDRIAEIHSEEPTPDDLTEIEDHWSGGLAKVSEELGEFDVWVEDHAPELRHKFDRFAIALVGSERAEEIFSSRQQRLRPDDV
jgi:hypothetical protein